MEGEEGVREGEEGGRVREGAKDSVRWGIERERERMRREGGGKDGMSVDVVCVSVCVASHSPRGRTGYGLSHSQEVLNCF